MVKIPYFALYMKRPYKKAFFQSFSADFPPNPCIVIKYLRLKDKATPIIAASDIFYPFSRIPPQNHQICAKKPEFSYFYAERENTCGFAKKRVY